MNRWKLVYEGFDPAKEPLREALCTLGNGYFGTRGAGEESTADGVHYPGTYLAGGYNRLESRIAGRTVVNEDLVNFPNWLCLTFRPEGGDWFDLATVDILAYRQELDMRRGLLTRRVRFRDRGGRVFKLVFQRLVHMGDPHLAAIQMRITAENWSGRLSVRSALDGRVVNVGVARYHGLNARHLKVLSLEPFDEDGIALSVETTQSRIRLDEAARTRAFVGGRRLRAKTRTYRRKGIIGRELEVRLARGRPITIEKLVSIYSSKDPAISESGLAAREAVRRAGGFAALVESHAGAWRSLWQRFDMAIEEQGREQMILRLHIFHLLQTASMNTTDFDVGIPARGLHGEAYRGHVFWDELFIFPLLNLGMPEITRALLMYRYRRLERARAAARAAGYKGAMYPWQSASDGREVTQELHFNPRSGRWIPDHSRLQRHVGGAVAYNVWQYYQASADKEFLARYGAEMILEIARFWSAVAIYSPGLGRYEIDGVMGPDEYHDGYPGANTPGLKNNVYTNILAAWVVKTALDVLRIVSKESRNELVEKLGLSEAELRRWRDLTRRMRVVFHGDGIISQFEGYDALEEFDWTAYRRKYGNIERLDRILEAEGDSPNRYKVSKQADVLMLFYLFSAEELRALFKNLGYPFDRDTIPKNIAYYMARTSHGSTLSHVVNAWVLARVDRARSWDIFRAALGSDVADIQGGTTQEGIHLGAMAAAVDIVQRCYVGAEPRDGVLWFNPSLPTDLRRVRCRLRHRGRWFELGVTSKRLRLRVLGRRRETVKVGVKRALHRIKAGEVYGFDL